MILIIFVVLSSSYSLYAPTFEGPDENYHYIYIKNISENNLPESMYLKTAPLYYTLLSLPLNFIDYPNIIEVKPDPPFYQDKPNRFFHGAEEIFPFSETAKVVHSLRIFSILF